MKLKSQKLTAKDEAKITKDIEAAFSVDKADDEPAKKKEKQPKSKKDLAFLIIGIVAFLGGAGCLAYALLAPEKILNDLTFPTLPSKTAETDKVYSDLTGEELSDASLKNSPVYCIQTPNGLDGARPQTGLKDAGVVFEAIAEGGITRFAAIYQNPTNAIIGPIRSLRIYYLDWDVPFDCTIIHAGGSQEAVNAVNSYKHISEDYNYMYRGEYGYHLWNNLFTTPDLLSNIGGSSNVKGFSRVTPETANKNRIDSQATKLDITAASDSDTSALNPSVSTIRLSFGSGDNFSPVYQYNSETNTYDRYYAYGGSHDVYMCPSENLNGKDPQDYCYTSQVSPSVVVAMIVDEHLSSDGVHEAITTIGSNTVYIFQNGEVIKGKWSKASRDEQIRFYDESGAEISLNPGQTWISAIPTGYGGYVDY